MPKLNSPRLILSPRQNDFNLKGYQAFIAHLTENNFLGPELESDNNHQCFETGDDFLHQITYLGCSPTLYSNDDTDGSKTFISIIQHDNIQFVNSSPIPPARCPHCQKTDKNWPLYFEHWANNNTKTETCPQCGTDFNFTQMKWKKNGGYGKLFIQVHGIQEQLAVPNRSFIDLLESLTETDWEYFFAV